MALQFECSNGVIDSLKSLLGYLEADCEEREGFVEDPSADHVWIHLHVVETWFEREAQRHTSCPKCHHLVGLRKDGGRAWELCDVCRREVETSSGYEQDERANDAENN